MCLLILKRSPCSTFLRFKLSALMDVSIIIPVLNEALVLPCLMEHILPYSRQPGIEVLFVDGGSRDASRCMVSAAGFRLIDSEPGRARQMNTGAEHSRGRLLLFLHADSRLPPMDLRAIEPCMERGRRVWGRFDVCIEGCSFCLPLIAFMMNLRSRLTGIATGDQAIFVQREVFERVGGFPDQPLMEDVEFSKRLKRVSRPLCLHPKVITSGRRWDQRGALRTVWLMWRLRLAYWMGVSPARLQELYR